MPPLHDTVSTETGWKYISSSKETGMNLVQLLSTPTLAFLYSARHQNYLCNWWVWESWNPSTTISSVVIMLFPLRTDVSKRTSMSEGSACFAPQQRDASVLLDRLHARCLVHCFYSQMIQKMSVYTLYTYKLAAYHCWKWNRCMYFCLFCNIQPRCSWVFCAKIKSSLILCIGTEKRLDWQGSLLQSGGVIMYYVHIH